MSEFADLVESPSTKILEVSDSKSTVLLKKGQLFEFRIDENPSTGYQLKVDPVDQAVFEWVERYEAFVDYKRDKPFVGAGGTRIYQLQAGDKAGQAPFRIAYARSWEYNGDFDSYKGTKYEYLINVGE